MTDKELLTHVKQALNITGTFQDNTLLEYIAETKNYMTDAGVSAALINSDYSVGCITRGVSDLWNYGMGSVTFSEYFYQRVIQLRLKQTVTEVEVTSTPGLSVGYTLINVEGGTADTLYKYMMSPNNIDLPFVDDDLSTWTTSDGVSEILGEDRHKICVAEATSDYKARSAGVTTIRVCLR